MNTIQIWIGDLAEYNNGNLVGDWVTLPCDLNQAINDTLINGNEEYFIGDIDSSLDLKGYSINELNEIAEKLESYSKFDEELFAGILESGHFSDLDDVYQCIEDGNYMVFHDCKDMSDVAYSYYEETGMLQELEKVINTFYIDWEKLGRDMDIEGYYYHINNDTIIQIFS